MPQIRKEHPFSECPSIKIYRLITNAPLPQRADKSAGGTLPTRATRFCEPVTTASSFGWWLFSPMDFTMLWDGEEIFWRWKEAPDWEVLSVVQFPDFVEKFNATAPEVARDYSLPFLTALPEPGIVQIWTGLMVSTAPGWSLLIRPLANLPNKGGYKLYEGLVETDIWVTPIFTNLRLTRTNQEIPISQKYPIAQIQPIPRIAYSDTALGEKFKIVEMEEFTDLEWDNYNNTIVEPNKNRTSNIGAYAAKVRRRRRNDCPFSDRGSALSADLAPSTS